MGSAYLSPAIVDNAERKRLPVRELDTDFDHARAPMPHTVKDQLGDEIVH